MKKEDLKIALVFSGQLRNLNDTKNYWVSLKNKYNMDVFGSFWENDDKNDNINNFISIYNPIEYETESYNMVDDTMINQLMNDIKIPYGVINPNECKKIEKSGILYMTYKMWKSNALTKKINKKYDIIIRARTDFIFENLEIIKNDYFNVPHGAIYLSSDKTNTWGFTDIFSYSSPEIMDYYSSFIFYFMSYIKIGYYIWSPEILLRIHLNQKKITINSLYINPLICRVIDGLEIKNDKFSYTNKPITPPNYHHTMNPSLIHLHPNQTLPYTETGYYKTCYLNNENIYDKQIK